MNNVLIDKQAATLAGRMLCASTLAYSIPNSPPHISPPNANIPQTSPYYNGVGYYSPPSMIQNGLAACTIGQNQDGIILAFRGTVYDSLYDWLDDLLIVTTEGTNLPGRVHSGFYDDLMKIIHVIASSLQTLKAANPGQNLIITGHSKGAGMAPIAAYYLFVNYSIKASGVYLFAPPLPGNADFANSYNGVFPNTTAYENYNDITPILPPSPSTAGALAEYFTSPIRYLIMTIGMEGYTPVGSTSWFIEARINNYKLVEIDSLVRQQQLKVIERTITSENFDAFIAAHSSTCWHGYMSAICHGVCTLGSEMEK